MIVGHLCAILESAKDRRVLGAKPGAETSSEQVCGVCRFVADRKVQLGRWFWNLGKETLPPNHEFNSVS